MVKRPAQSPVVNKPLPRDWPRIQRLLGITGTAGLVLLAVFAVFAAVFATKNGVHAIGAAVFHAIGAAVFLAIPFGCALLAFWQFREGRRWWLGVIAGFLGLVFAFLTGSEFHFLSGSIPFTDFFSVLKFFFNLLLFLIILTYVILAVAGVWTQVAYFDDQKRRAEQVPVSQSSRAFFYADGNQVIPAYVVQTSTTAVIAFVLAWFVSPIGLILGYVALNEIIRSQGTRTGAGLAKAAIIIGWVWGGAIIVVVLIVWLRWL